MIQLVLTVCSFLQGASCYPADPIVLKEGVGMIGCLIAGSQEAAKWPESHPNQYVSKITCEPYGKYTRM